MNDAALENKLDTITELLQNLRAIELSKNGPTPEEIRKHSHVGKETINKMLKGTKKERA